MLGSIALVLLSASAFTSQEERRLDDKALGPLAAALGAYFDAREGGEGLEAASSTLASRLSALEAATGGDPLRLSADFGRALWLGLGRPEESERKGKVSTEKFVGGSFLGAGLEYAYRLPKDYDPARASYPLLVALPDEGEGPAQHLREAWVHPAIQQGAIVVVPAMPRERGTWARVSVAGRPGGLTHLLTVLRVASERFAVDFDRVFIAGKGKGVPVALAAGNYGPQLFAGVIGRAGDLDAQSGVAPANFGNLPTLFLGAGANARAFQEALAALGLQNCKLEPSGGEEEIWSWMRLHPRQARPAKVSVVPGDPFPTRAYWLRIAPTARDARASATIERQTNTIQLETHGCSRATLYLNDALIDLDQPVRVLASGGEHVLRVRRHLATALDLFAEGTSDPGCAYVAEVVIELADRPAERGTSLALSPEFLAALEAAGTSVEALRALHASRVEAGQTDEALAALRRIARLAPEDESARAALGQVRAGGQWFSSSAAAKRFELRQEESRALARGNVKQGELWMHPSERSRAGGGFTKDQETGLWFGPEERRKLAKGWALQDFEWIAPEEAGRIDLGLWKVDGEWIDLASANRRRARIENAWRIPGAEIVLRSTADREVALRARREMERALDDMLRVFGQEPPLPLEVFVLRDEEQYDRFAFGEPDGRRRATHAGRLHAVHNAFFAESAFERRGSKLAFAGLSACIWDPLVPHGDLYGVHSARLALGLAFVEAIDPSPKAVRKAVAAGPAADHFAVYQAEKKLPAWLRYGAAVYAERYFRDDSVPEDGDPFWARRWSIENMLGAGGWRGMSAVLAFPLDPDQRDDARKLLIEAGLVVSFLVDGECEPLRAAHQNLQRRIADGRLTRNELATLEKLLLEHEAELLAFAAR